MTTLDLSNHDYSTFDPVCLKAAGVERVILGCWNFAIAETMLLALRAQGIVVEDLYCFLYYRLPWEDNDVLNATALAIRHGGITRIWMDCESGSDGPGGALDTEAVGTTVADRLALTQGYHDSLSREGYTVGIYTGYYWWRSNMGDSPWFGERGVPLWLANYGTNDPDSPREPITAVNFGGWTDVAVHQYSSTIHVCGRGRDHNYWFMEGDSVTREEYEDLMLAVFSGSEEKDLPRDQRLANAEYRKRERVIGNAASVADTASSAMVVAQEGNPPGESVPQHYHTGANTGGVVNP